MLSNYIEQLFKLDNYYDGLIVTDNKGYIEFFMTYRPDISGAKQEDLVGKHVLDIYPGLTEETSTIMRVLRSGEPIYNEYQTLITCREEVFQSVNTTMPIRAGGTGEIIGAIDVSRYASRFYEKQSINLHSAHTRKGPFYCVDDIITCSEDMEAIKRKIPLISKTDSTVLITGRSGTGKELIAQSIHTSSNRADKAFVSQNCAAIPATLLESILFGTTKGSYTGAENKPGLFEIANGGTLFLDEINSMDISVQPKLLRAIEEKRVCRLGSYKPLEVDVKIYVLRSIIKSDYGKNFVAIQQQEVAAEMIGINVFKVKMTSLLISAFYAGIAGGLFAFYMTYISPGTFNEVKSTDLTTAVVMGGINSISGPILCGFFLILLPEVLRSLIEWRLVIYGLIFVLVMIFKPEGLFGYKELPFEKVTAFAKKLIKPRGKEDTMEKCAKDRRPTIRGGKTKLSMLVQNLLYLLV